MAVKTADVIVLHVGQYQDVVLWSINLDLEMGHKGTKVGVNECKLCQGHCRVTVPRSNLLTLHDLVNPRKVPLSHDTDSTEVETI